MKKSLYLVTGAALLSLSSAASAATITLTDADAAGAILNVGTLTSPATEPADDSVIATQSYTIADLNLDNDGIFNDTITFSFDFTAVNNTGGVGVISWDHSAVGVREYDIGGGTFNDVDESVTFGAITLTGAQTTSEGAAISLESAVFTELSYRRWGANDRSFISGSSTTIASNDAASVSLNDTTFTTSWIDTGESGDTWNLLNYDISLTVVPEPSTYALLAGLTGLVSVMLRRRRA